MRPEPDYPSLNSFIGDFNAALSQKFFDITEAQIEPSVQPDSAPDDRRREVEISITDRVHLDSLTGSTPLMHASL